MQAVVEFNDKAARIFFPLYEKFKESVKKLDRQKDENVFQLQKAKYLQTLKMQLEELAKQLMKENKSSVNINQLNKQLTGEINQYLNEFTQKSRSL